MTVFRYDRSFEGLLTALFDAYARREFPERLIGAGEPVPMFAARVYDVVTDPGRAGRVWRGLECKLPAQVRNMLMHVWLSEEDGSDELLMRYMRRAFDSPAGIATDFSDADTLAAKQLADKVSKEALYVIQFVRFQKAADGTYFAAVSPRYNALPLAVHHFRDRFADQRWMIYDLQRRYAFYYDMERVTQVTLPDVGELPDGKLDESLLDANEKLFQDMWRGYFKAMTIKERINPKLHRRVLPRRFWKYLTEKQ